MPNPAITKSFHVDKLKDQLSRNWAKTEHYKLSDCSRFQQNNVYKKANNSTIGAPL